MKLNTYAPQKSRAQAMVEFAIVLPLLLLLVYGLLEAGRLLFIYSSIVTATRQASRYGSATGQGGDYTAEGGPSNTNIQRYQDCYGIRRAAQRVDFLNSFDDSDITIEYDSGPGSGIDDTCDGDGDSGVSPSEDNDSRIVVTIAGNYLPIVPRIVPFLERSNANSNPIRASSARTIIVAIAIEVTPPPGSGIPTAGTSILAVSMSASPMEYAFAGELINLTYTLTNNGTLDLSGIVLTPTHGAASCPGTTLAPGASMTCTGSYVTTPADVTAGSIIAQASATGTDGTNSYTGNATVTITWVERPELTLAKSASTEYATTGGTVVYTFTLTNSGNVPLTGVTVSDPPLGGTIAGCGGDLPVGGSLTCTTSYVVTAANVNAGQLVNTATASGTYGTQTVTSSPASTTVWTGPLFLRATAAPGSLSAPGTVTYTYELINNTGVILNPPYTISGHRGTESCSTTAATIPVGGSITCTGTFAVTQTILDDGSTAALINNVQAGACTETNNGNCPAARRVTSNTDPVSVALVRNPAVALAILSVTPNPATTLGSVITFTYSVGNTGNVTLQSPTVTDTRATGISCTPATPLAPAAATSCTGTYTVTQQDIDNGSISGQATAIGTFSGQTVSSPASPYSILTYVGPRVRLQITPNPTSFTGIGQFIVYTYTLRNTGSVPLYGPYTVQDSKVTFVDCAPATSPLSVGASTTCVGSYASTQSDVDAGNIINSASITASDGTQIITSNSAMAVVYVPGAPTITPLPTNTGLPTPTRTATTAPTAVTGCGSITTSAITTPTDTMRMTITNPNSYAVTVSNVVVTWNPSGGTGNPSTLTLQSARLGTTTFFTGSNNTGSLTITPSTTLTIAANSSPEIVFTFDKNYQTESGESIVINLSTPGCESTPIHRP